MNKQGVCFGPWTWLAVMALCSCGHDWDSLDPGAGESQPEGHAGSADAQGGDSGKGGNAVASATMVALPQGFSIDSTEVTRGQYEAWLATDAPKSGQLAPCSGNNDFAPHSDCMVATSVCAGADCSHHPQVCVDWCDAVAYCSAVGKRLCGHIGGGPTPWEEYAQASSSQWMNACSASGGMKYPYGNGYAASACNGPDHPSTGCGGGACTTQNVGVLLGCQAQGAYAGVFDLSGNVQEWEDSCDGSLDGAGECRVRGGAFDSVDGKSSLRCSSGQVAMRRDSAGPSVGFRCCSP